MKKMTRVEFLFALDRATCQAHLNMGGGLLLRGWQVRDAIDRVGLPLPPFKNLDTADKELRNNPIFRAVSELANPEALTRRAGRVEISLFYPSALAEAAWEYYQVFMSVSENLEQKRKNR